MVANQMAKFNYWKEPSFKVITEQVADGESRKECIATASIPGNSKFERGLFFNVNMIYILELNQIQKWIRKILRRNEYEYWKLQRGVLHIISNMT